MKKSRHPTTKNDYSGKNKRILELLGFMISNSRKMHHKNYTNVSVLRSNVNTPWYTRKE